MRPMARAPLGPVLMQWALPPVALLAWFLAAHGSILLVDVVLGAMLLGCVKTAVHHADVVAHRVGEPLGTLVLTLSVTVIEVALIVSMMLHGNPNPELVRDTVHATVILVLHGVAGVCIVAGTLRHRVQEFSTEGASAFLSVLIPMIVLVLILPNYTTTVPGPYYSPAQMIFVSLVCLLMYGAFLFVQTVRHKEYFLARVEEAVAAERHAAPVAQVWLSFAYLVMTLAAVVLLAEALAPVLEDTVLENGAPPKLAGVVVAMVVLMPETLTALHAARRNRLQTSINLALGSALASIGLTVPVVVVLATGLGRQLILGTDAGSSVLLVLTFAMAMLTYGLGRTNLLSGIVHLILLVCYLFLIFVP